MEGNNAGVVRTQQMQARTAMKVGASGAKGNHIGILGKTRRNHNVNRRYEPKSVPRTSGNNGMNLHYGMR